MTKPQMQQIFNQLIIVFIITLLTSCNRVSSNYILSKDKAIIRLEKQDHKFCSDLKLDGDKSNGAKSRLYWRCRLSMTKYKIRPNARFAQDIKYNLQINDLISRISVKLAESDESPLVKISRKLDDRDHKKCISMGFIIDTNDEVKINDYFLCRKALIEDYQVIPPFLNPAYIKYPSHSYNLGFAIDARIDQKIKAYNQAEKDYPTCINFYSDKNNFKKCATAQNESRSCLADINKKRFKKESDEKISCQRESFLQFPDSFLKENNSRKDDIERTNKNSDYYNHYSFISIGIDDLSKFTGDNRANEKIKKEINPNSKDALYTRNELNLLRQDYVTKCQKKIDDAIKEYAKSLENECNSIAEYKEIEL